MITAPQLASRLLEDETPEEFIGRHRKHLANWRAQLERYGYGGASRRIYVKQYTIKECERPGWTHKTEITVQVLQKHGLVWNISIGWLTPAEGDEEFDTYYTCRVMELHTAEGRALEVAQTIEDIIRRLTDLAADNPNIDTVYHARRLCHDLLYKFLINENVEDALNDDDLKLDIKRFMPEVRLQPRHHGRTGEFVGLDVMLDTDRDPVWVGFLAPWGNTWRISSWAWLSDREARELLINTHSGEYTGYFQTAKAAAEHLVKATQRYWKPVVSLQPPPWKQD